MNKKIVGILICMLFIGLSFMPLSLSINIEKNNIYNDLNNDIVDRLINSEKLEQVQDLWNYHEVFHNDLIKDQILINDDNEDYLTQYWVILVAPEDDMYYKPNESGYYRFEKRVKNIYDNLVENGFKQENMRLLTLFNASISNFKNALGWISKNAKISDIILLFFSDHGNENGFSMSSESYHWSEMASDIEKNIKNENIIIFIESCHSGAAIPYLEKDGRIIITACKKDELAYTQFGWNFASALKKQTDEWGNNNNMLSIEEVFDYATQNYDYNYTPQISDQFLGEMDICFYNNSEGPNAMRRPSGEIFGHTENNSYYISCVDLDSNELRYCIDWGDEEMIWTDYHPSGQIITISHNWNDEGIYNIRVKAENIHGQSNDWSSYLTVYVSDQKPTAEITHPKNYFYYANNSIFPFFIPVVFGWISICVHASHLTGIDHAELKIINSNMIFQDIYYTYSPGYYHWDWGGTASKGKHIIKVTIYANNGETIELTKNIWKIY